MGAYDLFYLGWAKETTPGTSLIVNAASTAYLFGSITDNAPLPDPEWTTLRVHPAQGTRTTTSLHKLQALPTTTAFGFLPHNALPIWMALGKSSTAGAVHTITAATAVAGIVPQLPSITLHAERLDSGAVLSDWVTQYAGCRVAGARFYMGDDAPELTCVLGWMGRSATKMAFKLTNKPADYTGTLTSPLHYLWGDCTVTYDGVAIQGITHWEISVENGTHAIPGQYASKYPAAIYQGDHQTVTLKVRYRPQVLTLHDDLLATTVPAKNWVFTIVRSAGVDQIVFTCTTAATTKHPVPHPVTAGEFEMELEADVVSLSVAATDGIAAAAYGE